MNRTLFPFLLLDDLLTMAHAIGLHITRIPARKSCNLYVWCRPDGGIVYIGKSETTSRVANELGWIEDARFQIDGRTWSAFAVVMLKHQAVPFPLYYDAQKSDLDKAKTLAEKSGWAGEMADRLLEYRDVLTVSEVERVLIRMPLATGNFTANSTDAGLWANKLNSLWDHLAQFAAIECGYRDF